MSNNGNGKWFHSIWTKGGGRSNPVKPGWYAARPECCDTTVKLFLSPDLLNCYVEGSDLNYDVYDFEWWYPLKGEHDRLPEFRK